jgi:hypothetical protein
MSNKVVDLKLSGVNRIDDNFYSTILSVKKIVDIFEITPIQVLSQKEFAEDGVLKMYIIDEVDSSIQYDEVNNTLLISAKIDSHIDEIYYSDMDKEITVLIKVSSEGNYRIALLQEPVRHVRQSFAKKFRR